MATHDRTCSAMLVILALLGFTGADAPTGPVLHLTNGGFVPGALLASPAATVRWQAPMFAAPFEFDLAAVDSLRWPVPEKKPMPQGDDRFELIGGDTLFGSLAALDDEAATLDIPKIGRLRIARANLCRIVRRGGREDIVYNGPNGLAGWKEPIPKDGWREDAGQPVSDLPAATLRGDLGLPLRAVVEFELSWKTRPDFVFALGSDETDPSFARAFHFEVWDGDLVVYRETEDAADLALVQSLGTKEGPGRVHLLAYLDQKAGRILVAEPGGKFLADLTVPYPNWKGYPGVLLRNVNGDLRLERLTISPWDGTPPRESPSGKSRIHRTDGSVAYGVVTRYDAAAQAFVLREDAHETRIAADALTDVFLAVPAETPAREVHVVYNDGTRLSGALRKLDAGAVEIAVPGISEPVRLALQDVRSVTVARHEPIPVSKEGRPGTLEMTGLRLPGHLVDAKSADGAGPLHWHPDGARGPAPLRHGVAGQIVYIDKKNIVYSKPVTTPTPQPQPAGGLLLGAVIGRLFTTAAPATATVTPPARRGIHLRTGDILPDDLLAIDEDGVTLETPQGKRVQVPHAKIKAAELAPLGPNPIKLTRPSATGS